MLDTIQALFDEVGHKLSTMPSPMALVTGMTMLALVILMEQLATTPIRYAALKQLRIFPLVFQVVDRSCAFLFGVFIYHTIRQLDLVHAITPNSVRIDLFRRGPLQASSGLTASTALGMMVRVYRWMLINPDSWDDPAILGFVAIVTVQAVAVFVWPLYGIHRRMATAKERMLHEIDLCFKAVFSAFNAKLRDKGYAVTEGLAGTIANLEIERERIAAIPTWPWGPEAAQFALTAIALPIILTIVQLFVERAFGS